MHDQSKTESSGEAGSHEDSKDAGPTIDAKARQQVHSLLNRYLEGLDTPAVDEHVVIEPANVSDAVPELPSEEGNPNTEVGPIARRGASLYEYWRNSPHSELGVTRTREAATSRMHSVNSYTTALSRMSSVRSIRATSSRMHSVSSYRTASTRSNGADGDAASSEASLRLEHIIHPIYERMAFATMYVRLSA